MQTLIDVAVVVFLLSASVGLLVLMGALVKLVRERP